VTNVGGLATVLKRAERFVAAVDTEVGIVTETERESAMGLHPSAGEEARARRTTTAFSARSIWSDSARSTNIVTSSSACVVSAIISDKHPNNLAETVVPPELTFAGENKGV